MLVSNITKKFRILFFLIIVMLGVRCLSDLTFLNPNTSNKNDYNEYINRERDKEKIKKYYYIEKNKQEQIKKECFEMEKEYISKKEHSYVFRQCK
ncbi:MAG: hypothetical protein KatS3mg129_2910 [Leptospiraceae bacterium]|nr:MAG: hypothetical protein KatS3mg129_2910 [Leptospiraceae bacterium]